MAAPEHRPAHRAGSVHLDEAHWRASATHTELEGEVLLAFVTDTAVRIMELRGPDATPVRRIIDIGSGPGVGTCQLAELFPDAHVVAVDSSPAMLDRAARRAVTLGLEARISTQIGEVPGSLDGVAPADVIWTSMALHHIGDEVTALHLLGELLDPNGLIAIAERADPMRVLPDELGLGRPGLAARLDNATAKWFARMREGLTDSVPSTDLASMLTAAGLEVVGSRLARVRLDAPLSEHARRVALGHLHHAREHFHEHLDDDDLHTLDVLSDADDPRSVMHRSDVFVAASRQIFIARPVGGR